MTDTAYALLESTADEINRNGATLKAIAARAGRGEELLNVSGSILDVTMRLGVSPIVVAAAALDIARTAMARASLDNETLEAAALLVQDMARPVAPKPASTKH